MQNVVKISSLSTEAQRIRCRNSNLSKGWVWSGDQWPSCAVPELVACVPAWDVNRRQQTSGRGVSERLVSSPVIRAWPPAVRVEASPGFGVLPLGTVAGQVSGRALPFALLFFRRGLAQPQVNGQLAARGTVACVAGLFVTNTVHYDFHCPPRSTLFLGINARWEEFSRASFDYTQHRTQKGWAVASTPAA